MGCHTWFSVPYIQGKEDIIKKAQDCINNDKYSSNDWKRVYQYAIDNEICDVCCDIITFYDHKAINKCDEWKVYINVNEYCLISFNRDNNTNYESYYEKHNGEYIKDLIYKYYEHYSDEPRIGGYPDKKIHSYDEMVEFMNTGYTDEDDNHFDFYYDKERHCVIMESIKQFFTNHPDGIIYFD